MIYPQRENKIKIDNSKGQKIIGTFSFPSIHGLSPIVIICHGFKGNRNERHIRAISKGLEKAGFATLRFDFTNNMGDSDGRFENVTISQEIADLDSVFNFIFSHPEINNNRIGLVGHSLGGFVSAVYAGNNKRIKSLALLSAVFDVNETIQRLVKDNRFVNWQIKGYVRIHSHRIKKDLKVNYTFMEDANNFKDKHVIAQNLSCPLFVLHGDADESVSLNHNLEWIKFASSLVKKKKIVHNADHTYKEKTHLLEVVEETVSWFKQTL